MNAPANPLNAQSHYLMSVDASATLVGTQRQSLENSFSAMSANLAPSRLQLATSITQRHYTCNTPEALQTSITQSLAQQWQQAHMAFTLNDQDGPWAVAISNNALAWAAVAPGDLSTLKIVGDFLALVYHHLR